MTEETKAGASGGEVPWGGMERRRVASDPETPGEAFLPVPADWQHRGIAFLIDVLLYALLHFGGPALGFGILGGFLGVLYITFRDGLFGGQSVGKKILGIRVVHMDGRPISYVDSSFRNVIFIIYLLMPRGDRGRGGGGVQGSRAAPARRPDRQDLRRSEGARSGPGITAPVLPFLRTPCRS